MYVGPYKIIDRPSESTIRVKLGTFKSGVENIQLHHWSNCKPASVREDTPEAEMPTRGRKPKTSNQAEVQPSIGSEPDSKITPVAVPKVNKHPTRRSVRIQNKLAGNSTSAGTTTRPTWSANIQELATLNQQINSAISV